MVTQHGVVQVRKFSGGSRSLDSFFFQRGYAFTPTPLHSAQTSIIRHYTLNECTFFGFSWKFFHSLPKNECRRKCQDIKKSTTLQEWFTLSLKYSVCHSIDAINPSMTSREMPNLLHYYLYPIVILQGMSVFQSHSELQLFTLPN